MNEREALEKIKNSCQYEFNCKECHLDKDTCLCLIATQALAPQEPQQKTFTVEEVKIKFEKAME